MLSTNQALNSFVSRQGKPVFILRTGNQGVFAHFTPSLYQIRIVDQDGSESCHDVGFSGTRLLERLITSRGNALSREDLTAYAWPERVVGQGSLNQQIYTLRQLLNDDKERKIIQTLPRRGYLIDSAAVVRVDHLDVSTDANSPDTISPSILQQGLPGAATHLPVHADCASVPTENIDEPKDAVPAVSSKLFRGIFSINTMLFIVTVIAVTFLADWWKESSPKPHYVTERATTPLGSRVVFITRDPARNQGLKQKVIKIIARFDEQNKTAFAYEILLLNQHIGFNCVTPSGAATSVIIHNNQLSNSSLYDRVKHCYEH